jgi:hypothetical protein
MTGDLFTFGSLSSNKLDQKETKIDLNFLMIF